MKNRLVLLGTSILLLASQLRAEGAAVPSATEITAGITAAGGVAGAAAALGLSIWIYRKVKAKAGQAIG